MNRVLIVDDNPKNIQLLGNLLSEQNYDVEYAEDGLEAIELVASDEFDLILMDVMMPKMDGYEACKKIKEMGSKSEIPLIFITAKTDIESVTKGFECGGVDYITKPFNSTELLARVDTHISLKKSKNKLREMNKVLEIKVQERTKELRDSNEKLKHANQELEILDTAKNEFLNIISHEIRTPLVGILGYTDMIRETSKDKIVQEMALELDSSCKRLEDFSYNTLDISSLYSNGFQALKLEKINVGDIINNILKSSQVDIDEKKLIINKSTESGWINADKNYIVKCIRIIISNTTHHSPENGKIFISGKMVENFYTINVKDEGNGFPDLIINNGIKPFISPEHTNRNPGLDLYLCKLIVNAHKGSISIKNDNGGMVIVKIPNKL